MNTALPCTPPWVPSPDGLGGAAGAAASASLLPEIGERIATLNLPPPVRKAVSTAFGTALGAVGGKSGAAAGLNQAANNYVSHSPFSGVRRRVHQENARLLNECGESCTQQDFHRIDQQVVQVERAANLAALSQVSSLTSEQAQQFAQVLLDLLPIYGNLEALAQLTTGSSSLTGEEVNQFWAAVGLLPAGGIIRKVGEPSAKGITETVKDLSKKIENRK